MLKPLLALLALSITAAAEVKRIELSGEFDGDHNAEFLGLTFPIPYSVFIDYDDTPTHDWNPSPNASAFYFDSLQMGLTFGDHHIELTGTEVRVYDSESGLSGVTVGNRNPAWLPQLGLSGEAYYTIYLSLLHPGNVVSGTTIEEVEAGMGNGLSSYFRFRADIDGTDDYIELQENGVRPYVVATVPEPSALMLSLLICPLLWKRRVGTPLR